MLFTLTSARLLIQCHIDIASILLIKLWSMGITGTAGTLWSWFKNYLTNRYQRVSINNCYSDLLPVVSGVPQGSILGPLLFLVYINNISRHSYFHHLPSLWDAIPILDLNVPVCLLKSKLKSYLWEHFLTNFDENNNCTLHYLCTCSRSHQTKPPTTNYNHL